MQLIEPASLVRVCGFASVPIDEPRLSQMAGNSIYKRIDGATSTAELKLSGQRWAFPAWQHVMSSAPGALAFILPLIPIR
jgi:hypothetical protein